jgi:DNA-binding transcriptional ArsR family regulator
MAETNEPQATAAYFLTSPALETVFALNALVHPQKRPFAAAWAAQVEAALTETEQAWLGALRRLPDAASLGDLAVRERCLQSPLDLAAMVAAMPPDDFARFMLAGSLKPADLAQLRARPDGAAELRRRHPWLWGGDEAVLDFLLRRPAEVQQAYTGLLPRVWALGVQPMLPRLESLWAKTLEQAQAEAERKDPKAFAITVFSKPFGTRFGLEYVFPQYLFVPSYFCSPTRLAFTEPDIALLTLDCRLGPWAMAAARGRILEGLKAVTEENRLEILRLLMAEKGFGGWVAGRLKLNPATVTHHMTLLRKAGLLVEEEGPPGAAKYYRTDKEAVRKLIRLLQEYLDSNLEPDWEE